MDCKKFCFILEQAGIDYSAGVPCSIFTPLINYILESGDLKYIPATSEGEAMGIAAGAYLSGKTPMVLMQNSGLGNAVNPITSLNLIYNIPSLLLISGRGYEIKDAPEHEIMGKKMLDFLLVMEIPMSILTGADDKDEKIVFDSVETMLKTRKPVAIILKKGILKPSLQCNKTKSSKRKESFQMTRYGAIENVLNSLNGDEIIISTTGMISRETFTIKDKTSNFYMMGSMGCAAPIALGVADNAPDKKIIILDGDGAVLMKMGALATIGHISPKNLIHIVLDNEVYDSTGGQPTVSSTTKLEEVAKASNYRSCIGVCTSEELEKAVKDSLRDEGPSFILVKVKKGNVEGISRVSHTPDEIKNRFMNYFDI